MPQLTILAFIAGIVSLAWWPNLPSLFFLFAWPVGGVGLLLFAQRHDSQRWANLCLVMLGWALGWCWCGLAAHKAMADRWPNEGLVSKSTHEIHWVEGHVVGLPAWSDDSLRFEFDTLDKAFPNRLLVRWHRPNAYIVPGQKWRLPVRIEPPQGRLNFSGFDYEQYLLAEGIGGLARVTTSTHAPIPLKRPEPPKGSFDRYRQILAENIQANTTSLEVASLKRALLIGDRATISDDLSGVLRDTGTAHLLAISGLHVGMVAGLGMGLGWVFWVLAAPFRLNLSRRGVMVVMGWGAGLFYAGLAGFSLPTQRAVVMLGVACLALIWQRRIMPYDALLVAGVIVLVWSPLSVLSVGFWLSFVAVAFLIWGFAWRTAQRQSLPGVRALIAAQVILSIGLLPLNVGLFGQWSPAALVANLAAIPWVGFVVLPSLLLSTAAEEMGLVLSVIATMTDVSLQVLVAFLRWLSVLYPTHTIAVPESAWTIVLALIGAFWLLSPRGWPGRWVGLALMSPLLLYMLPNRDLEPSSSDGALTLSVLDMGSGLAVMAETNEYRLLYDTGPGDGMGRDSIGDVLKVWPRSSDSSGPRLLIDDLILSHDHRAHRGGLGAIDQWAWVRRAYIPKDIELAHTLPIGRVLSCHRGQRWSQGQWTFEFVHPGPYLPNLGGNSGCVLWIHSDASSVLLGAGLDATGEAHIASMLPDLRTDVLVVGRSGHKDTTSQIWLEQLKPRMAIISVSISDPYGRPAPSVVQRLNDFGVRTLQTSQCQAMRLVLDPSDPMIQVTTMAVEKPRFWRDRSGC